MSITHTYLKELETLVLDTLLPSYIKYQKSLGNTNPLKDIHPNLLSQIRLKRELPSLLKP
jgi:hypothetical protein